MPVVTVEAPPKTRHETLQELQQELGNTECTAFLLDYIQEAWETMDMLIGSFGLERASQIILCESRARALSAYFLQIEKEMEQE